MDPATTAFADESFRRCADGRGLFLLTAVVVPDDRQDEIRQALRRRVAPGQQRWHFRTESTASRRRFLRTIAELGQLGITASTYCCPTASQRKSERSRARLVWNLVGDLAQRDVHALVLESRQDHNDRKDRREIHWAVSAGVASAKLVYVHGLPVQEPLLWLPDAIAGAAGISIADGSNELVSLLPTPLREVRWIGP